MRSSKILFLLLFCLITSAGTFSAQGKKKTSKRNKVSVEQTQNMLTVTVKGVKFKMVIVDGGTFTMGASDNDAEATPREKPAHQVTVNTFAIGQTEVTQELWRAVMGKTLNEGEFKGRKRPMENVAYYDCEEFIAKLNELTGKKFRLPTEAEWEYAARGGNKSKGYKYAGGNDLDAVAWYKGNSGEMTHKVAQKLPNELGLYDMSGNVWEWCSDWYDENYYSASPSLNPEGGVKSENRVNRGGHWGCDFNRLRVSDRDGDIPGTRCPMIGFRLAMTL